MTRAEKRLERARVLLGLSPDVDVLAHIKAMPEAEREHLRGLVDWVEEYERYE